MIVGHLGQHFLQFAHRDGGTVRRLRNHGIVPRYGGSGQALSTARAFSMASRTPSGRTGNTSRAFLSRTTVGFFSPSIRCRPTPKAVGVTRASHSPDRRAGGARDRPGGRAPEPPAGKGPGPG